jgi:flavin reductase (DIM6/NTAB) family NADH-FMN oxidoreductase RutF
MAGVNWKKGLTGAPLFLDNTVAALEWEIIGNFDCGTHTIFLGKVSGGEIFSPEEPMTYAYYHEVKRGTSPETAPTYIRAEDKRR